MNHLQHIKDQLKIAENDHKTITDHTLPGYIDNVLDDYIGIARIRALRDLLELVTDKPHGGNAITLAELNIRV